MLIKITGCVLIYTLLLLGSEAIAEESSTDDYIRRAFVIDASTFSYIPEKGINSYRQTSSGMAEEGSRLGFGFTIDEHSVSIKLRPLHKSGRFSASVDMRPQATKEALGFTDQQIDMTDLKPLAIEIGKDKSGRVFQLNLTPRVRITNRTPRRFDANKLRLHNFTFAKSPIFLNDSQYVGRLHSSGGSIAHIDVYGVAKVEFSLYHLVGWEPWGVLDDGVITIVHPEEKTNLQISNVLSSANNENLMGGPYRVWVRWSEPSKTVEQHRQSLIQLRERLQKSDASAVRLGWLDKQIARPPGPWLGGSGVQGGLGKNEIVPEDDEAGTP